MTILPTQWCRWRSVTPPSVSWNSRADTSQCFPPESVQQQMCEVQCNISVNYRRTARRVLGLAATMGNCYLVTRLHFTNLILNLAIKLLKWSDETWRWYFPMFNISQCLKRDIRVSNDTVPVWPPLYNLRERAPRTPSALRQARQNKHTCAWWNYPEKSWLVNKHMCALWLVSHTMVKFK